jgi:hypothetical protein
MITNLYKKSMLKALASCSFILLMTANFLLVTEIILYVLKIQKNFHVNILYFFIINLISTLFILQFYIKYEKNH